MIFSILKFILQISTRVYFGKLEIKRMEHIPAKGPVLLVANHPSTFMDPLVIAVTIKRKVFFLTKAEVFKSSFAKWILPKFNMIPIYRVQDDPTQLHKKKETFTKSFEHLKRGGAILIFPEGISLTERKLKKIKTGAARIALGVEAENDFKLGVQIVTVGLNYSNPHRFQSDLFINIDEPIQVQDFQERYKQEPVQTVNDLTNEIRLRLEKQVVAIEDSKVDKLVSNIEIIYKSQLIKDLGYSSKVKEHDFLVTRAISEQVHHFQEKGPERVEQISQYIDEYFAALDRVQLNDGILRKFPTGGFMIINTISSSFYMIIGFPIFVFGVINNYLPYKIPDWISRASTNQGQFHGALTMTLGTFTFLIFYAVQLWLIHYYFQQPWITLAYLFILPLSGFFALCYWKRFTNLLGRWIIFSLFYKKTKLITSILNMRQRIIDELEKGRKEYADDLVNKI